MNLLKLKVVNFRVFNGVHEIEFANDSTQNVTLIHAENSMGKSTMLNAIKWCLYCKTPDFDEEINKPNHPPNVRLANLDCNDGEFEVELEFEHERVRYRAIRSANQKYMNGKAVEKGRDTFSLFEINNYGVSTKKPEPQATINSILPEELSDYFLFSGEIVSKKLDVSANKGRGYKKAVRDILGFTLSDAAVIDLENLKRQNTTKKLQILKADKMTSDVSSQVLKLREDLDKIKSKLDVLRDEKNNLKTIVDDCTLKIQNSDHKLAEGLIRQRIDKENEQEREEDREKVLIKEKIQLIEEYGYAIFGSFLADGISNIKSESNKFGIPASYKDVFIKKLLKEQACICDRKLHKGSTEYKSVESLLDTANTEIISDRVLKAFSVSDHFEGRAMDFLSNLKRISKALGVSSEKISALKKAEINISIELENLGDYDIKDLLIKQRRVQGLLDKKTDEISEKKIFIDHKNREIGGLNKDLERLKSNTPELDYREKYEMHISILIKRIKRNQNIEEKKALSVIAKTVQDNHDAYLRKEFTAKLDSDYNINLFYKGTDTIVTGTGEGQDILTKLSFITALISHSKLRIGANNTWTVPGTIAPFVIDAPFANMDDKYQKATLAFLPKQAHQLVLFLSSGQLPDGYEDELGKYIGKRYYFENHVPIDADIEDEILRVKEKDYQLVKRDWDGSYPCTNVIELK
jgi:DNA sulfur modification protein DndD